MLPAHDIILALRWYIVLLLIGVPGWVLVLGRSHSLPDKGYALGKALGLIGLSAISWILTVTKILPFSSTVLWILIALSWTSLFIVRAKILSTIRLHWKNLLISELVCVLLFCVGVGLRSHKPQIQDIEKYMDSGIVNSIVRTKKGVPLDPWYSGKTLNYYYFGHWMVGTVAKASHTPTESAFNLGSATILSAAGGMLFATGWALTRKLKGGLLVTFMALFASNLQPFIALIKGNNSYFFFSSGRFVEYRINEYPFYSLTLGDLHAHMLSLVLTVALALLSVTYIQDKKYHRSGALLMGSLLGLMVATNSFDTISCSLLVGLVLLIAWYRNKHHTIADLWRPALLVTVGACLPILIFLATFQQPTGGIGISLFQIPINHTLLQFGVPMFFLAFATLLFVNAKGLAKTFRLRLIATLDERILMIGIFFIVALALILITEIGFVKDIYYYTNPPYSLANTEFKVWYTAWIMLAIASGSAAIIVINYSYRHSARVARLLFAALVIVCSILGVGTYRGLQTLRDDIPDTLNGLEFLSTANPDRKKVADWANTNIKDQPIVLEATGDSYSNLNWFSSYTGLPTVMGWRSHEYGWRYSANVWSVIASREFITRAVYSSKTPEDLWKAATKEKISYILLGPDEVTAYSPDINLFDRTFGQPVFNTETIALYRTNYMQ